MDPLLYLLLATLLVFGSKLPLAVAMGRQPGGYNNHEPRQQQAALEGWGRRARAAHLNSMEAFPFFAAGLLAAVLGEAEPSWIHGLALGWLIARTLYIGLYLADLDKLRSVVWFLGLAAALGLMVLGAMGAAL